MFLMCFDRLHQNLPDSAVINCMENFASVMMSYLDFFIRQLSFINYRIVYRPDRQLCYLFPNPPKFSPFWILQHKLSITSAQIYNLSLQKHLWSSIQGKNVIIFVICSLSFVSFGGVRNTGSSDKPAEKWLIPPWKVLEIFIRMCTQSLSFESIHRVIFGFGRCS